MRDGRRRRRNGGRRFLALFFSSLSRCVAQTPTTSFLHTNATPACTHRPQHAKQATQCSTTTAPPRRARRTRARRCSTPKPRCCTSAGAKGVGWGGGGMLQGGGVLKQAGGGVQGAKGGRRQRVRPLDANDGAERPRTPPHTLERSGLVTTAREDSDLNGSIRAKKATRPHIPNNNIHAMKPLRVARGGVPRGRAPLRRARRRLCRRRRRLLERRRLPERVAHGADGGLELRKPFFSGLRTPRSAFLPAAHPRRLLPSHLSPPRSQHQSPPGRGRRRARGGRRDDGVGGARRAGAHRHPRGARGAVHVR